MEKLGDNLDGEGGATAAVSNPGPEEARKLSIQRCNESLVHACQCRDTNCRLPSCHKMKRVVSHTKQCKEKTNGGCPICKQMIALCCNHAKLCQADKCPVPFCLALKKKLSIQRCIKSLVHACQCKEENCMLPNCLKKKIGQQKQEQAQRLSNTSQTLMAGSVPPPGVALQHPTTPEVPVQGQGQIMQFGIPVQGQSEVPIQGQGQTMQLLQQLIHLLKSPQSAQQQEQVLQFLKSNPSLMAAFIKQRAYRATHQQQNEDDDSDETGEEEVEEEMRGYDSFVEEEMRGQ